MSFTAEHIGTATLDFGAGPGEGDTALITVSAPWVNSSSVIQIQTGFVSVDHDPEDALIESVTAFATNIIPGVSFDIQAGTQNGTWGRYAFRYLAF